MQSSDNPTTKTHGTRAIEDQGHHTPPPLRWKVSNGAWGVLIFLWAAGSFIVLPRPTVPQILPLPTVDATLAEGREALEIRRANLGAKGQLSHDVRLVGELVRRVGKSTETNTSTRAPELFSLRREVNRLATRPETKRELLVLRALQGELFLQAVDGWNTKEQPPAELVELGGPFAAFARTSWGDDRGGLLVERNDLRLFFRVYWTGLVGLSENEAFAPTLNELRRYYRTNLLYPPVGSLDSMSMNAARGAYAQALGRVDPSYPGALTRGILELRQGRPDLALRLFDAHLARTPEGPWANIARNAKLAASRELGRSVAD